MGGAQHELAAHPFEGALLGDVMQHHHRAEDMPLGVAHRRQAVGQQAQFALDFHFQVVRRALQAAAAQHQLQLLVQFRATQRLAQALAEAFLVPAQLALCHRVEVLQAALPVDHQQAVVDAVEHRLQALLAGEQLIDIGCLMLAQGFGHDAEAPGQLVHLRCRRNGQGHLEIALPDLVGGLGQRFDRRAEPSGDAMGGNKTDDQHREADQPQQPGDQQGALAGFMFAGADVFQGLLVLGDQAVAQDIEGFGEFLFAAGRWGRLLRLVKSRQEALVVGPGPAETAAVPVALFMGNALVEQLEVTLFGRLQRLGIGALLQHHDQLIAQALAQFEAQVEGDEVAADRATPGSWPSASR